MHRRAFIFGIAFGLATGPVPAKAQGGFIAVGLLTMGTITPHEVMWSAFLEAMRKLGYVEGRNLVVRTRCGGRWPARPPPGVRYRIPVGQRRRDRHDFHTRDAGGQAGDLDNPHCDDAFARSSRTGLDRFAYPRHTKLTD